MTQSIIVYRNPLEAALWESDTLPALVVFVILTGIIAVALFSAYDKVMRLRKLPNWGTPNWITVTFVVLSCVISGQIVRLLGLI
jgi:hypothetical protein